MSLSLSTPVVIDNGTHTLRAGFLGEDAPKVAIPCNYYSLAALDVRSDAARQGSLYDHRPMRNGQVVDEESLERLMRAVMRKRLCIAPDQFPVVVTERDLTPRSNTERMLEIMYEKLNVPFLTITRSSKAAVHALGRTTGLAVDIGHGVASAVPVIDGKVVQSAANCSHVAGAQLTSFLSQLLSHDCPLDNDAAIEAIGRLKETLCYVRGADGQTGRRPEAANFALPDGRQLCVGEERVLCPELLFQPSLGNSTESHSESGVHELVHHAIANSPESARQELCANVVVCGGSTEFPGFLQRLKAEVMALQGPDVALEMHCPEDRVNAVWLGASVMASMPTLGGCSKEQYEEVGSRRLLPMISIESPSDMGMGSNWQTI